MISSMTGYGRGDVTESRMTIAAEVRSINSRFLEISLRLPQSLTLRENDIKDIVRKKFIRGKISAAMSIEHQNLNEIPLKINASAAKSYYKILSNLKKTVKIQEKITLDHLLKFPEVLEVDELDPPTEKEWELAQKALSIALTEAVAMRRQEGQELMIDLVKRIQSINQYIDDVEQIGRSRLLKEPDRLKERLREIITDRSIIDEKRLEFEMALLADKLDITEECVRFRSHNKYFFDALENDEAAGRKLTFLIQEMNREANTIGAKANNAEISHKVVAIKEELEKVREQLQNIE